MSSNRLATEASPYLRMHATNPVEWYPWGEEAFARARAEDKPIFLSIGYYTCHWCHVMERESFSSPALAAQLNRDFVSIKVDREERPDVDRLYMNFVQATTGSGGWPLTAFLTPGLKPFYGGTYFPPEDRQRMPGFGRLLGLIAQSWREERPRLLASAEEATTWLAAAARPPAEASATAPGTLLEAVWPRLLERYRTSFDRVEGGFGSAPKFPRPVAHAFLLRYARHHSGDVAAREATAMVVQTLRAMARGGLHDALGGGFHRYATDAGWRVPHFEKMLYDQAQLAVSYIEAWLATRGPDLAATARSTLDFVLREMTGPDGGFYSAQDADSPLPGKPAEVGEGAYYLWTGTEIEAVLDPELAAQAIEHYGVGRAGNIPRSLDPQGEFEGKNILYGDPALIPAEANSRLYAARRQRPWPPTDDKVLTAWNGLMISALALGAAAFDEPRYAAAAQRAARWLQSARWNPETGALLRTAAVAAFVEDYAFLIHGLLDLYQADFDPRWLDWARTLQQRQETLFAAPDGSYYSAGDDPHLWLRMREDYDGAEPSPNSVAVSNLLRLALWFEADGGRPRAERLLASFAARLLESPETLPLMASTLELAAAPPRRLLIAGERSAPATQALLRVARERFLPGYNVMVAPPMASGAAAYLCEDYACRLPISDPAALAAALES